MVKRKPRRKAVTSSESRRVVGVSEFEEKDEADITRRAYPNIDDDERPDDTKE